LKFNIYSNKGIGGEMSSPLKVIRKYCLWCMAGQSYLVAGCETKDCPLFLFRMNKSVRGRSRLKAIRKRCLDCAGSSDEVKSCNSYQGNPDKVEVCPLWEYRFGKNPKLKGKRGNPEALRKYLLNVKT